MFTNHLAAISEQFKSTVTPARTRSGQGEQPRRRAAQRRRDRDHHPTPGAIGYIEWGYAKLATRRRRRCRTRRATMWRRVARVARWRWRMPSSTATRICASGSRTRRVPRPTRSRPSPGCCSTESRTAARAEALRGFVEWALKDGQAMAEQLGYIGLPEAVVAKVAAQISTIGAAGAFEMFLGRRSRGRGGGHGRPPPAWLAPQRGCPWPLFQPTRVDGQRVRDLAAAHGRRESVPPQLLDPGDGLRGGHHRAGVRDHLGDRAASRRRSRRLLAFLHGRLERRHQRVRRGPARDLGHALQPAARVLDGGFFGITVAIFPHSRTSCRHAWRRSSAPSSRCSRRSPRWSTACGASSSSSR